MSHFSFKNERYLNSILKNVYRKQNYNKLSAMFDELYLKPVLSHFNSLYKTTINPIHKIALFSRLRANIRKNQNAIKELEIQKKFFKSVIDSSPNFVFAKDKYGRFVLANKAVADAYGTSEENLIGKTDSDFNSNKEQVQNFLTDDAYVIETQNELQIYDEVVTDIHGNLRYLYTIKKPLYCPETNKTLVLGISTDVTARKKAEDEYKDWLRKLENSQKLESLGLLASGIAHDFNNILQGVIGNISLANELLEQDSPSYKLVSKALESAIKAAEITTQLLSYSGKGPIETKKIELNHTIEETLKLVEHVSSKKATISYELQDHELFIYADLPKIRQVILNLVTNALEAINKKNGFVKIKTKKIYEDYLKNFSISHIKPTINEYVMIEISDNGCGIPDDAFNRIFEPFFSTKLSGRGIGLATVQGIIQAHGGFLDVKTQINEGSTFTVILPLEGNRINETIVNNDLTKTNYDKSKSAELLKVLVIDDESISREVCQSMLDFIGIKSDLAVDGQNGIETLYKNSWNYSAIILDITMPRLDGIETYESIRKHHPQIPILFSSGFSPSQIPIDLNKLENTNFIQKPFTMSQFKNSLNKLLDKN